MFFINIFLKFVTCKNFLKYLKVNFHKFNFKFIKICSKYYCVNFPNIFMINTATIKFDMTLIIINIAHRFNLLHCNGKSNSWSINPKFFFIYFLKLNKDPPYEYFKILLQRQIL